MATGRPFWALLLFLAIGRVAVAQDVLTISGTITTRTDGLSVPGAVVSVVGADASATADTNGQYTLKVPRTVVRGDRIRVKVDALGLPPTFIDAVVNAPTITVDVALTIALTEQVTV